MTDPKQLFRLYQRKFQLTNWLNEPGEPAKNDGHVAWFAIHLSHI